MKEKKQVEEKTKWKKKSTTKVYHKHFNKETKSNLFLYFYFTGGYLQTREMLTLKATNNDSIITTTKITAKSNVQ